MKNKPHIVVLGAGFAGLTFVKRFPRNEARITVIDRTNHHLFQPLLYQVASAGLAIPDITQPIRSILAKRDDVTVLMDEVRKIDLTSREVHTCDTSLEYDFLVIAMGAQTSYFGNAQWEQYAPGLKTIEDAARIRRDVLYAFEQAEMEPDEQRRRRLMTVAVIGGGPTGVELAGAFAELKNRVLRKDFRRADPTEARIVLIEAGPRILSAFSEDLSAKALAQLHGLGAETRLNSPVVEIADQRVVLKKETIEAINIIWAAGVSANPITEALGVGTDRSGRLQVTDELALQGHPEVFAIGDIAAVLDRHGKPVPGTCPAAIQMGAHVADVIEKRLRLGPESADNTKVFKFLDKGNMATIGRSHAIAAIGPMKFSGLPAWLAWLMIHLVFLVGFRNRISVFINWIYSYFTFKRGARVIHSLPARSESGIDHDEIVEKSVAP